MPAVHVGGEVVFRGVVTDENDTIIDISGATTKQFTFRKPGGTLLMADAVLTTTGADGQLEYQTVSASPADLDTPGTWWVEAYLELPSGTWTSDPYGFDVRSNLGDTWPR